MDSYGLLLSCQFFSVSREIKRTSTWKQHKENFSKEGLTNFPELWSTYLIRNVQKKLQFEINNFKYVLGYILRS